MRTSYVADDKPTTATMNIGPLTCIEAHLSQEKITRKKEEEEKSEEKAQQWENHSQVEIQ